MLGIDPGRFTLRRLTRMYAERMRQFGELAAWAAAVIVAHIPFTGERLSPAGINPYRRVTRATRKAEEVRAFIASMAWQVVVREAMERGGGHAGRE